MKPLNNRRFSWCGKWIACMLWSLSLVLGAASAQATEGSTVISPNPAPVAAKPTETKVADTSSATLSNTLSAGADHQNANSVSSAPKNSAETFQVTTDASSMIQRFILVPFDLVQVNQSARNGYLFGSFVFTFSEAKLQEVKDTLVHQGFTAVKVGASPTGEGGIYIYQKQIGDSRVSFSFDLTQGHLEKALMQVGGPLGKDILKPIVAYLAKYKLLDYDQGSFKKWVYGLGDISQDQQQQVANELKAALKADHWEIQDYQLGQFWVFLRGNEEVRFGIVPGDVGENIDVVYFNYN